MWKLIGGWRDGKQNKIVIKKINKSVKNGISNTADKKRQSEAEIRQ